MARHIYCTRWTWAALSLVNTISPICVKLTVLATGPLPSPRAAPRARATSSPEERFLVHGNCGFGNVMVHEGRITGILDWLDAKYGDFVFDLAWLDLWSPEGRFAERFQHYYATKGTRVEHYTERLRCYQCYIGLDGLRFFAKMQNHDAYRWIRQRILSLLQS